MLHAGLAFLLVLPCGTSPAFTEDPEILHGRMLFERIWRPNEPGVGAALDRGYGKLSNGASCVECHPNRSRASSPFFDPNGKGLIVKVRRDAIGSPWISLFRFGSANCRPPLHFEVSYTALKGKFGDGSAYELQRPWYRVVDLDGKDLTARLIVSPRLATEVLPVENGSGRGMAAPASRGLRFQSPTLEEFIRNAFADELGMPAVTRDLDGQVSLPAGCADGGDNRPSATEIRAVAAYLSSLPPVRQQIPDQRGLRLLADAKCLGCHLPAGNRSGGRYRLFDMGNDLADQSGAADPQSRMWRAPGLFSIAEMKSLNPIMGLLHDGRARSVEEAILWHGGEGEGARQVFIGMKKGDREKLTQLISK